MMDWLRYAGAAMAQEGGHGGGGGASGGEGGESGAGMPQLDFSTWPNQLFWLIIALVALYYILDRIALPRIASVLAERQGTISNDLAMAEELRLRAQNAEKAYERKLSDARAEAQRIAEEARQEMQKELDAAMREADEKIAAKQEESEGRIEEIRANAEQSVRQVATETAAEIVATFGRRPEGDAVEAAVGQRVGG